MPSRNSVTSQPSQHHDGILASQVDAADVAVEVDAHARPVQPGRDLLDVGRFAGAVIAGDHDATVVGKSGQDRQCRGPVEPVIRIDVRHMPVDFRIGGGNARIMRVAVGPSIPGIITSINTTSKRRACTAATPRSPSCAKTPYGHAARGTRDHQAVHRVVLHHQDIEPAPCGFRRDGTIGQRIRQRIGRQIRRQRTVERPRRAAAAAQPPGVTAPTWRSHRGRHRDSRKTPRRRHAPAHRST